MTSESDSHTCTILFADDEEMLLQVSGEFLKEFGYRVLGAAGGKEAVKIYEDQGNGIDLVILDMFMPDMHGTEACQAIKDMNPDCRVLMASGHNLESDIEECLDLGCTGFVKKPYTMMQLRHKIEEALNV
jgi:CheY-like chemotaxis protein